MLWNTPAERSDCMCVREHRRTAGIDVDDGETTRLGATEPGSRIAEVRPGEFLQSNDVGPESPGRGQIVCLDGDMKKPVDSGERQCGFGGCSHMFFSLRCASIYLNSNLPINRRQLS